MYLKTPNAPGQRTFSRCAAPFFLEIRQYSCEKMSCSAQKFLAAGHIGSFQIHPKFRSRTPPASPRTLFFHIFSLAREKIWPPEARQKRPRRNEPPQATSLILCARFFLSKPQTKFAVWIFLCKSDTTSQSRLRRASSPGRGAFLSAAAEVIPLPGRCRGRGSRWSRTGPRMCPLSACRSA